MNTFYCGSTKQFCPNHAKTASTWVDLEEKNYLANLNYQLVNQINETATEKCFYRTRLNEQFRSHNDQLQQAFRIISEKNSEIISLQEQLDIFHKDLRSAADDYIALKRSGQADKEALTNEMLNNKVVYEEKLKKMQEQFQRKCELKIKKRVQEVQSQCADRVKLFTDQIDILTENSKRLTHELSMLQEDYRQMLLKNDTIIQQSIQRQLRKRDFEAQNNYLSDLAQYQTIKNERNHFKQLLSDETIRYNTLEEDRKRLMAKIQVQSQRVKDLEEALEANKQQEKVQLFDKYPDTNEAETNTDKQFVPITMPIDMNLMSEVVSLRQFLIEKLMTRFLDFFEKTVSKEKKTSKSLLTFSNCFNELRRDCADLKILLFLHGSIQKIVQVYCPSLNNYSRQYLAVKDDFVRKTLIECETISNHTQRLYRLLDLLFRLKNPLNHSKGELSAGELKMLEMKLLICLKKNFRD